MRKPRSVPPNFTVFVKGCLHHTNARTAEMCKLTENSSRDVQIAFANELSLICDRAGINVWELISLANKTSEGEYPAAGMRRRRSLYCCRPVFYYLRVPCGKPYYCCRPRNKTTTRPNGVPRKL